MNQQDVINFFDRLAPVWDQTNVHNDAVIKTILDLGGICEGIDVLDVACGTGILFPDYISRKVSSLTAVDLSPKMVQIARSKFPNVDIICDDILTAEFSRLFDAVMVYNAFPHFPDPERLISVLTAKLKRGGRLTVAHGISREELNRHHSNEAADVSISLLDSEDLASLMSSGLDVDVKISDAEKYIVSGILR